MKRFLTLSAVAVAAAAAAGCGSGPPQAQFEGSTVYCNSEACFAILTPERSGIFTTVPILGLVKDGTVKWHAIMGILPHQSGPHAGMPSGFPNDPLARFLRLATKSTAAVSARAHASWSGWPQPVKATLEGLGERHVFLTKWPHQVIDRGFARRCPGCEIRVTFVRRDMMRSLTQEEVAASMSTIDYALVNSYQSVGLGKVNDWRPGFSVKF